MGHFWPFSPLHQHCTSTRRRSQIAIIFCTSRPFDLKMRNPLSFSISWYHKAVSKFVPWTKFVVLNKVSQTSRTALGIYKKEIPFFVNTIDINSIQPTTFILSLSFPSNAEIHAVSKRSPKQISPPSKPLVSVSLSHSHSK